MMTIDKSSTHFKGQFKISLKSSNDIKGLCELSQLCKKYDDRFKSVRIYTENPTKGLKFEDGAYLRSKLIVPDKLDNQINSILKNNNIECKYLGRNKK